MTTESGSSYDHLTKLSPKDHKFDVHKAASMQVANLFGLDGNNGLKGFMSGSRVVEFASYESRINGCGTWLKFWQTTDDFKLIDARFCKVPYCPMCQFRRSLKWRAKFMASLPLIRAEYPKHQWVFLTLTVKNCHISELRQTIKLMNQSWQRLSQLAAFPMDGAVKALEVTRIWDWYDGDRNFLGRHGVKWWYQARDQYKKIKKGSNPYTWTAAPTDEVHPHFHILGMVPASYYTGRGYIKQAEWTAMWQRSLRVDYPPIVHIKKIENKKGKEDNSILDKNGKEDVNDLKESGMLSALLETLKYTVKEQDLLGSFCDDENINSDWLKMLTEQLYLLRRVEYKGVLKEFGKDIEKSLENLIEIDEEKEEESTEEGKEVVAFWSRQLKKYLVTMTEDIREN